MNITLNAAENYEPQSARMLILLKSGEQRLITFTLPKDSCTVQELLEQVTYFISIYNSLCKRTKLIPPLFF